MNAVLVEIYSTVIPSAPYVIAAYALVWVVVLAYVVIIMRGQKKAEAQMTLIEEALADRDASARRM